MESIESSSLIIEEKYHLKNWSWPMKKGLQYSFLCPPSIDNFFEKPYTDDFGIGIIVIVLVLHDIWSIVWGLVLMVPLNLGSGALCICSQVHKRQPTATTTLVPIQSCINQVMNYDLQIAIKWSFILWLVMQNRNYQILMYKQKGMWWYGI